MGYIAGFANLTLCTLVWLKTRKETYRMFTAVMGLYLLGIMLGSGSYFLENFVGWGGLNKEVTYLIVLYLILFLLNTAASSWLHLSTAIPFRGLRRAIYVVVASVPLALLIARQVLVGYGLPVPWFESWQTPLTFASIEIWTLLWSLHFLIHRRRISDQFFVRVFWFDLGSTFFLQPFYVAYIFSDLLHQALFLPRLLRTLVYLAYNLVSLVLLLRVHARPLTNDNDYSSRTWEHLVLTSQEKKVLGLVDQGLSNKEIAYQLGIGLPTVKSHLQKIYQKTGLTNRVGLHHLCGALKASRSLVNLSPDMQ